MVLPSNSCPLIHPNNTSTYFKIDWQTPIEVEGEWEASLSELSIFYLQQVSLYNRGFSYYTKLSTNINFRIEKKGASVSIHLINAIGEVPTISHENPGITVKVINGIVKFEWLHDLPDADGYKIKFSTLEAAKYYGFDCQDVRTSTTTLVAPIKISEKASNPKDTITITYEKENENKAVFIEKVHLSDLEHMRKYILEKMSSVFSSITLKNQTFTFTLKKDIIKIQFDEKLREILSLPKGVYQEKVFDSGQVTIFEKSNYQIFVYTDLIENIIVGDTKAPLLRTIWIEPKHVSNRVTHVTLEQPMYLPLSKNSINNIEFNLRHDSGEIKAFADKTKSVLTIHCRKIK